MTSGGWKVFLPRRTNLEGLSNDLRNPYLVVVFRDMAATMKAHMRWHKREITLAAHEILMQQQKNWFLVETLAGADPADLLRESDPRAGALRAGNGRIFSVEPLVPEGDQLDRLVAFLSPGSYK